MFPKRVKHLDFVIAELKRMGREDVCELLYKERRLRRNALLSGDVTQELIDMMI